MSNLINNEVDLDVSLTSVVSSSDVNKVASCENESDSNLDELINSLFSEEQEKASVVYISSDSEVEDWETELPPTPETPVFCNAHGCL